MIEVEALRRHDYRHVSHAERPCLLCGLECSPNVRQFLVQDVDGKEQLVSPSKLIGSPKVTKVYIGPDCWQQNRDRLRKYVLPG